MKTDSFEDFLKGKHAEDYMGTDDEMPDRFEGFVENLDADDWIKYGDEYGVYVAESVLLEQKKVFSRLTGEEIIGKEIN